MLCCAQSHLENLWEPLRIQGLDPRFIRVGLAGQECGGALRGPTVPCSPSSNLPAEAHPEAQTQGPESRQLIVLLAWPAQTFGDPVSEREMAGKGSERGEPVGPHLPSYSVCSI